MLAMDDYRIRTPEQTEISYTLAGLGTRFLALTLDLLIQTILLFVLLLSLAAASGWREIPVLAAGGVFQWYIALMIIIGAFIFYGYFFLFEWLMKGRTPGKAVLGLRVVRRDGRALDFSGVLLRNLIRLVDFMPALYAVGALSIFISKDSRRLGDIVAGTVVIAEEKKATLASLLAGRPADAAAVLNDREHALVRDFLARRSRMAAPAREKLAEEIAAPLYRRMQIPSSGQSDPEAFLKKLIRP